MPDTKKPINKKKSTKLTTKSGRYFYGIGRRKSAVAQVRLYKKGNGEVLINEKSLKETLPYFEWQKVVTDPLTDTNLLSEFDVTVRVNGGGPKGRAESIRLGIARALLEYNADLRKPLKAKGYLTRDSRIKERKKPGLKGARRAPQWSKR